MGKDVIQQLILFLLLSSLGPLFVPGSRCCITSVFMKKFVRPSAIYGIEGQSRTKEMPL